MPPDIITKPGDVEVLEQLRDGLAHTSISDHQGKCGSAGSVHRLEDRDVIAEVFATKIPELVVVEGLQNAWIHAAQMPTGDLKADRAVRKFFKGPDVFMLPAVQKALYVGEEEWPWRVP